MASVCESVEKSQRRNQTGSGGLDGGILGFGCLQNSNSFNAIFPVIILQNPSLLINPHSSLGHELKYLFF